MTHQSHQSEELAERRAHLERLFSSGTVQVPMTLEEGERLKADHERAQWNRRVEERRLAKQQRRYFR